MRKTLLLAATLVIAVASLNAQGKKKEQAPVDESYQVVNLNSTVSVCFDTASKRFDMVCYVIKNGQNRTEHIVLGTEFHEIARNLMASIEKYNVTRRTVDYVLKYMVLYREMPMQDCAFSLDYCTDYALKLNLAVADYDISLIPVTFAISDPDADAKLKQLVPFSKGGVLTRSDLQTVRELIEGRVVKSDFETEFFMKVAFPHQEEESAAPAKSKKAKADKNHKDNKSNADKKAKEDKSKEVKKEEVKQTETKPQEKPVEEKKEDEGGKVVNDDQWKLY